MVHGIEHTCDHGVDGRTESSCCDDNLQLDELVPTGVQLYVNVLLCVLDVLT